MTAYELCISDWSSYVCSSDLYTRIGGFNFGTITKGTGNALDLDVRHASGLAITGSGEYLFVADYGVPAYYWFRNTDIGEEIDNYHQIGSKIMVIADSFSTEPTILGSTSPIPMSFLEDIMLDVTEQKL